MSISSRVEQGAWKIDMIEMLLQKRQIMLTLLLNAAKNNDYMEKRFK